MAVLNGMLKPGDYFCVRTDSWIAGAILAVQRIKALDREARYNHAGIVVSADGTTFESLRRIGHYDINRYAGCDILVARHRDMTPNVFLKGYREVKKWDGTVYPAWRLVLHALGLAKFLHAIDIPVCSELVVEHCRHAGLCDYPGYGWNPDHLADKFRNYRCYDTVYEGAL